MKTFPVNVFYPRGDGSYGSGLTKYVAYWMKFPDVGEPHPWNARYRIARKEEGALGVNLFLIEIEPEGKTAQS